MKGIRPGSRSIFSHVGPVVLITFVGKNYPFSIVFPLLLFIYLFIFCLCLFTAAPVAHGGSQDRGPIGAVAAGLRQSHSNARSEPRLQPTPQLMAMPDP